MNLNLIKIGFVQFTPSMNFHEYETSKLSISFNERERIYKDGITLTSFTTGHSNIFNLHITPKWQFNYKINPKKSRVNFFIGAGCQPFYIYEKINPTIKLNNQPFYNFYDITKQQIGSHFIITPRMIIFNKKKFLLDIGVSKTIYKFHRTIQKHEHGIPNVPEKRTDYKNDLMPIDFELNFGIGIKLNSKK